MRRRRPALAFLIIVAEATVFGKYFTIENIPNPAQRGYLLLHHLAWVFLMIM